MMDRQHVADYLAALSEQEFADLAAEARAVPEPTPVERLRAAEDSGDWRTSFALKAQRLGELMSNPNPNRKD